MQNNILQRPNYAGYILHTANKRHQNFPGILSPKCKSMYVHVPCPRLSNLCRKMVNCHCDLRCRYHKLKKSNQD